jgi:hypothetical protein
LIEKAIANNPPGVGGIVKVSGSDGIRGESSSDICVELINVHNVRRSENRLV